jgi:ADP-ribosylglycohydrolase
MIGAISGDIIGSVYEHQAIKTTVFPLFSRDSTFTDDTVLTVAVADSILNNVDYAVSLKRFGRRYPHAGYGASFYRWMMSSSRRPYNSWGNGSAMRVSPVGFAYDTMEAVLYEAEKCASVTHNHPEGVKGAQATAQAIWLARKKKSKHVIRQEIGRKFNYDLDRSLDEIRPGYGFDVSCQGTVPEAIIAFMESKDFEDAVRKAISLGGDSDTLACIAGGIAQAYYGEIPPEIVINVRKRLPEAFLKVIDAFNLKYHL